MAMFDVCIQVNGDRCSEGELTLKQMLHFRNEELMQLHMQVQELRKRERALTDRWVLFRTEWELYI